MLIKLAYSVDGEGHGHDVSQAETTMLRFSGVYLLSPKYLDDDEHEFSGHDDRTLGLVGDTDTCTAKARLVQARDGAVQPRPKSRAKWRSHGRQLSCV